MTAIHPLSHSTLQPPESDPSAGSGKPQTHVKRPEHVLIEAARTGDKQALEQLLVIFQPDVRRIAYSQCASFSDAEDAAQESMWLIYNRIGALRTITSFSGWLFSIIRNECRRLLRKGRRENELTDVNTASFAYQSTPDLRSDLAAAIQSLPEKYREAILLRDFQEYSISEIAQHTRLSRAAVKSRIHRGREMIREYLIDYRQ